ncbi:N-acetyltransferase 9-like protein [Octopus bimaculoides]|uniref:N-acetyltransferase 9-like protein n=1 Tax=Octopus bimaculoides TaxID=37653 RepID=A0A0L8FK04_OCTBM|nr:N-acetyltransferase 9-like protein [Octopus bimaculoides]|eukprot:XP_014789165.1 PREDICTED: N-acetyltransferase 9-like protein [Octopus bimaculoides]
MLINCNTKIISDRIILVPYEAAHVPKYNCWMQSDELLSLTASERLTLEEEYENQISWRQDEKKCTFIILDHEMYKNSGDEIESMIGDINLFFNDPSLEDTAEIEVMIAEISSRRKGFGKQAVILMMVYGVEILKITKFTAKIGMSNSISLGLFLKIGFIEESRSSAFQEITLSLPVTDKVLQYLRQESQSLGMRINLSS